MTSESVSNEGRAKNCLFVVLDTVRAQSTYIGDVETTPRIAQLAEHGLNFKQAIATAPWTLPSHASMYTGLYPTEHGANHHHRWLPEEHDTLAEQLQKAGIRTGLFTANMYLTESFNMSRGFDKVSFIRGEDNKLFADGFDPVHFLNSRKHDEGLDRYHEITRHIFDGPVIKNLGNAFYFKFQNTFRRYFADTEPSSWDEQVIEKAVQFASQSAADDTPFFAMLNLIGAHAPWEFDRELLSAIGITPENVASSERWKRVANKSAAQWPFAAGEVSFDDTEREILRHLYHAWIYRMDTLVGRLLDSFDDILDETLVIITADHGELLATNQVLGHSIAVDEEVVHVPLVITGPNVDAETVSSPVSLRNIYGTVLSELGVDESALTLFDDANRGVAYAEVDAMDPTAVNKEYREVAASFGHREALFTDEGWAEYHEYRDKQLGNKDMFDRLQDFSDDLDPWEGDQSKADVDLSPEIEERLRKLGYKG